MKRIALAIALLVSLRCIPPLCVFSFAVAQAGTLVEQKRFHLVCRVAGVMTTHYHVGSTFDGDARFDVAAQDQLYVDQSAHTIDGMGLHGLPKRAVQDRKARHHWCIFRDSSPSRL
jgi:hypothetical protein